MGLMVHRGQAILLFMVAGRAAAVVGIVGQRDTGVISQPDDHGHDATPGGDGTGGSGVRHT